MSLERQTSQTLTLSPQVVATKAGAPTGRGSNTLLHVGPSSTTNSLSTLPVTESSISPSRRISSASSARTRNCSFAEENETRPSVGTGNHYAPSRSCSLRPGPDPLSISPGLLATSRLSTPAPVSPNRRPSSAPSFCEGVAAQEGAFPRLPPLERGYSFRVTRKIFNNWRAACGRTRFKTKDFIKKLNKAADGEAESFGVNSPGPPSGSTSNVSGASGFSSPGHGDIGCISLGRNIVKKRSEVELVTSGLAKTSIASNVATNVSNNASASSSIRGQSQKSKSLTGWSVHVWATWVQRGSCEDDSSAIDKLKEGRQHLSDFQKVKLTHFFSHVLDMNRDDVISAEDFVALNQRIRHYVEWSSDCIEFHILKEVHSGFLECFLNQPLDDYSHMYYCNTERETRSNVKIDEWLDVWGLLLKSKRNVSELPLWLQYLPKILFQVINKSGSGRISKEELRSFHNTFLGIDLVTVAESLDNIYNAMTDDGRSKLNYTVFKLCFANFLFGRYPNGPGQYLFGICSPQTLECSFPIDYSALNTPPDDLEPYDPDKDKAQNRRSVIV